MSVHPCSSPPLSRSSVFLKFFEPELTFGKIQVAERRCGKNGALLQCTPPYFVHCLEVGPLIRLWVVESLVSYTTGLDGSQLLDANYDDHVFNNTNFETVLRFAQKCFRSETGTEKWHNFVPL